MSFLQVLVGSTLAASADPVRLIIDTDIGGGGCRDVDDVAAICIANALVDNGEAELLAVVHNTYPPACPGAISVLNHWYGHDDVPIGSYGGGDLTPSDPLSYVNDLVANFPSPIKNKSQVPTATAVYRKALAGAPDRSVSISSIGLLTNLRALLESAPDEFSALGGVALVEQKVALLAVMGGKYPTSYGTGFAECNFCGNGGQDHKVGSAASAYVAAKWPRSVRVLWSGFNVGAPVQCGGALTSCAPPANPCRQAFIDQMGAGNDRDSWDPLTTLIAVRGAAGGSMAECTNCDGYNEGNSTSGDNRWVPGPFANQSYLVEGDKDAAGKALDQLLCQPPKTPPPPAPTPPPSPRGDWAKADGLNCYGTRDGGATTHGATDLESPASASCGVMSVAACQAKCLATDGCDAIATSPASGGDVECYRKKGVDLARCDGAEGSFDTYVHAAWAEGAGYNCYGTRDGGATAHGATDMESPASADCGVMSVAACQAKCLATPGCGGVAVQAAAGGLFRCFRKRDIDLPRCDAGTQFSTWLAAEETGRHERR